MMTVLDSTSQLAVINRISNEQLEKVQFGTTEQKENNTTFGVEL